MEMISKLFKKAYKYHGLGNDFLLFDSIKTGRLIKDSDARLLCDRHFGVGADGILTLLPSKNGDFYMHIYNADGSVAEMCGNGIRCAVKYYVDFYLKKVDVGDVRVETKKGVQICKYSGFSDGVGSVLVNMGPPIFDPKLIPVMSDKNDISIKTGSRNITGFAVSMGNPHFVLFGRFNNKDVNLLGHYLERHNLFPKRTNVEFAKVISRRTVHLLVWERGVGITLACGSGACATVAAGVKKGKIDPDVFVEVRLPGGVLDVKYDTALNTLLMKGPVARVCEIVF